MRSRWNLAGRLVVHVCKFKFTEDFCYLENTQSSKLKSHARAHVFVEGLARLALVR